MSAASVVPVSGALIAVLLLAWWIRREVRFQIEMQRIHREARHRKPRRPVPVRGRLPIMSGRPRVAIEAPPHHVHGEHPGLHLVTAVRRRAEVLEVMPAEPLRPLPELVTAGAVRWHDDAPAWAFRPDGEPVYNVPAPADPLRSHGHAAGAGASIWPRPAPHLEVDDPTDQWTQTFNTICPAGRR